ncbi:MAG: alpha-2-macroglobulin, partial [Planctomycetes bacterium]|nr:alpha-2-macroglobulin [Planctomycetota bacterium]
MKTARHLLPLLLLAILAGPTIAAEPANQATRQQLLKTMNDGNFKDAYDGLRKLALDPADDPLQVGNDLQKATDCLQRLNRVNEIDAFREAVIEVHKDNWRLLQRAAQNYMQVRHHGFIVSGEFWRGQHRGGGQASNAMARDRVRALQLMQQAIPLAREDDNHGDVASFLLALSQMMLNNRGYHEAWRLQYLSDLSALPDYEPGYGHNYGRGGARGAPVDEEGKPVFHYTPKSWATAETDGQRWRWCLEQAMEFDANRADDIRMQFAEFLCQQFGVQSMAQFGWRFGRMEQDDTQEDESGTYALHTLKENETIARLATGVKRFELPDEFNFIRVWQQVAKSSSVGSKTSAMERLASVFENRRQYPKAAGHWKARLAVTDAQQAKDRLAQIVDNWGQFEPIMTQPAGKGATVEYRFRNGKAVEFTAHEINVQKLLADVKAYLKSQPKQPDHQRLNIGNIGYLLVQANQSKYLGEKVESWKLDLEPRENHFDRRVTVETRLKKAGAYLLVGKMAGGNTSNIVVWLSDTAIVKKHLANQAYYYVADAISGAPLAKVNLEFFGWRFQHHNNPRRVEVLTKNFAEFTDADGHVILGPEQQPREYQWLITATTDTGRFAYLGFTGVWYQQRHDAEYNATKVYVITDRPVYRPEQKVNYKFWVRHAKYDREETSDFAGKSFTVEIRNPKGDEVLKKTLKADDWGGLEDNIELAADAMLGVYRLQLKDANRHIGGGSFRVEEYKKPEFEVTVDAPTEPVMLGEKITATINAKYYFGSPVTHAKVKYKVTRTNHTERWYPWGPWDWFYGPGYWWFAYDYTWYPGWKHWGCSRPIPFWWPQRHSPPEIVAEQEVEIGEDGTVKVEIDTAVAKAIHPDMDHKYSITAEVVDQSRRTIVGSGNVLVARKPFKVTAWLDRGYYRSGDVIRTHFSARTLDGKPVEGAGIVSLYQITYEDGEPVEKRVGQWPLATNAEGVSHRLLKAARAGQFRLSYKVTDSKEHEIEGAYIFTIRGTAFTGANFRYNHVELIPDKREYAPGESVKLQVNTNKKNGTVLLFVRPTNGVYLKPEVIRLDGKSTVFEIPVTKKDMPNFFVEAVTVADGRMHAETKEIVVPPEKRVLQVAIEPSSEAYKPGEKAKVKVRLTDFFGEPFVGSTV